MLNLKFFMNLFCNCSHLIILRPECGIHNAVRALVHKTRLYSGFRRNKGRLVILFVILLLTGCSGQKLVKLELALESAHYLNPDINGHPSPLVVNIYELKTPYPFKETSYNKLIKNPSAILGASLIDKQSIEVRPGSRHDLEKLLSTNTHYIAVTGAYRNLDKSHWRELIKIPNKSKNIKLVIELESQGLVIKKI